MYRIPAPLKFTPTLVILVTLFFPAAMPTLRGGWRVDDKKTPPLKINGVFESIQSTEVKPETEQVKSLTITRLVPHGSQVKKGQKIFWFQTEALDKQIEEARLDLELAEKTLQEAKAKHKQFVATQKLDHAAAERNWKQAQQDNEYYVRVDRDFRRKSAEVSLRFSRASLENAEEELNQLEKMYRSNDLTEESEEIVLKRARQAAEDARFRFEGAQNQYHRTINETLPRGDEEQDDRFKRAEITYQGALRDLHQNLEKREIELQKQKLKFADQQEKFHQLLSDRDKMVIKAPQEGILLYGNLVRGALTDKVASIDVGKTVTTDQVIGTIVAERPLQVRLTVSEAELGRITEEMEVQVMANTHPDHPMKGEVFSIESVPFAPNKFDCVVRFRAGKLGNRLIPTTGCQVVFASEDAVQQPSTSTTPTATETPSSAAPTSPTETESSKAAATESSESTATPPAPTETPASAETSANSESKQDEEQAPKEDPISGPWDGSVIVMGQEVARFEMNLTLNSDDSVIGNLSAESESLELRGGKYDRDSRTLKCTVPSPLGDLNLEFKLTDRQMTADVEAEGVVLTIRAVRR